jgi:hypothetical protein
MDNENKSQQALFKAVFKMLRPLVRILLRNGVPYAAFTDLAKRAYVDVAKNEFAVPGKKQTNSRISTITGLSRKEIQRLIRQTDMEDDNASVARYNRAARVVYGWVHDKTYADGNGDCAELPLEGEAPSFSSLVRAYSGDVPPRAILDELTRVGVAECLSDNRVRLMARAYIPSMGEAEKLILLGRDVSGLIDTMDKNIHGVAGEPVFQRKVFYDNLSVEAAEQLHELLHAKGQPLLEHFDQWMARHDRDVNPASGGTGRKAVGIGLYYFEEDINEEPME